MGDNIKNMLKRHGVRCCRVHSSGIGQGPLAGFEVLGSIISGDIVNF